MRASWVLSIAGAAALAGAVAWSPPVRPAAEMTAASDAVSVVWTGDTMLADAVLPLVEEHGYQWPFEYVSPLLDADAVIVNVETAIGTSGEQLRPDALFTYRSDAAMLTALAAAGVDAVGMANNHSMDFGAAGLTEAIEAAQTAGLGVVGAGPDVESAGRPLIVRSQGTTLAVVAFAKDYGDARVAGPDAPGIHPLSRREVERSLANARSLGADFVAAFVHWGENYQVDVTGEQREQAQMLVDAGFDLVVGHGPHVVQKASLVDGVPVFYSLGNFVFGSPGRFDKDAPGTGIVLRTVIDGDGLRAMVATCIATDNDEVAFQPRPCAYDATEQTRLRMAPVGVTLEGGTGGFSDIDASPHRSDIVAITESGVTRGCNPPGNDRFCPGDPITRGQMAAFLRRAFSDTITPVQEERRFVDTEGSVFASDIGWLSATGITAGCDPPANDRFCPDATVTRGEMAAFLARVLRLKLGVPRFEDLSDSVFEADVSKLAAAGIVRGCDPPLNREFCPGEAVTREQMATLLVRSMRLGEAVSFSYLNAGGALLTPYCRNGAVPADPSRVVIVIHGSARTACEMVSTISVAAASEAVSSGLVVVAPLFVTEEEARLSTPDLAVWDEGGWKSGEFSLGPAVGQDEVVSSFSVVDALVEWASSLPGAPSVVVAGHSAGGQFVNRYAGATTVDARFVMANPSSYVYLSDARWNGASFEPLDASVLRDCPSVNRWKYGLENMTGYAASVTPAAFTERYIGKETLLLLGADDVERDTDLDTGCAAELQGENRLERGQAYFDHVSTLAPADQRLIVVPGVGHSSYDMFTSPSGRAALLGD